jgi:2-methylisocitrate lyase-like PEP mutase family enzyme
MANMVEGGKTPLKTAAELQALGFSLVIFPGGTVRALLHCFEGYLASLRQHGSTDRYRDRMADFSHMNEIVGTSELLSLGQRYDGEASKGKAPKRP